MNQAHPLHNKGVDPLQCMVLLTPKQPCVALSSAKIDSIKILFSNGLHTRKRILKALHTPLDCIPNCIVIMHVILNTCSMLVMNPGAEHFKPPHISFLDHVPPSSFICYFIWLLVLYYSLYSTSHINLLFRHISCFLFVKLMEFFDWWKF